MFSSNSHSEVHDAGAAITDSFSRSPRMASVVGEPSDWARARTSPSISV